MAWFVVWEQGMPNVFGKEVSIPAFMKEFVTELAKALLEISLFIYLFAMPIICGIVVFPVTRKLKDLNTALIFLLVSVIDMAFCHAMTMPLNNNVIHHGSEYSWWGFQLLWIGKTLVVNTITFLISGIMLIVQWKRKKNATNN